MTSSLVGSEMCIRDRTSACLGPPLPMKIVQCLAGEGVSAAKFWIELMSCLLYTSDAADDM
eukprot:282310-Prorocentrum_lima.AAC.1